MKEGTKMDIEKLAKSYLKDIRPYAPGRPIEEVQRERGTRIEFIKLASNENPYPPHDKIKRAVIRELDTTNRYPESGAPILTKKLAALHDVAVEEVFIGHGTHEILDLLIRAFVYAEENCVFSELSFAIYKIVCKQCGVGSVEVPQRDYTHDLSAMATAINDKTKLVFVCNPNNPTATYNTAKELDAFLSDVPERVLVVIDEAYHEFVRADDYPDSLSVRKDRNTIVVLRTFSKFYSLAGVRLGYAVADPALVTALNKMRQPFNVNRLAQAAAEAALECRDDLAGFVNETIKEREAARKAILELGFECLPSQTNFLFVIPKNYDDAVCERLLDKGVIVRAMEPFGGPTNSFRVNMGTPDENRRFVEALEDIVRVGRK
jgi:histidinol-phosphate aminotransferase